MNRGPPQRGCAARPQECFDQHAHLTSGLLSWGGLPRGRAVTLNRLSRTPRRAVARLSRTVSFGMPSLVPHPRTVPVVRVLALGGEVGAFYQHGHQRCRAPRSRRTLDPPFHGWEIHST